MNFLKKPLNIASTVAVSLFMALPGQAAIIGALDAVATSGGPGFGNLADTFNQNGLSASYLSGTTDFDSFVASTLHTTTFAGNEWSSNPDTVTASVTYDLGGVKMIDKMALWNEEFFGIWVLDIYGSLDGLTFTNLVNFAFVLDNLDAPYPAQVFNFTATSLRYLRLDMSGCQSPDLDNKPTCAIGEVAFNNLAAVPLPASGVALLASLGGLAALRRRVSAKSAKV